MNRRVAVTGIGAISAFGSTAIKWSARGAISLIGYPRAPFSRLVAVVPRP